MYAPCPTILAKWSRQTLSLNALSPGLYPRGASTSDLRGLTVAPKPAIDDPALGIQTAFEKIYLGMQHQRRSAHNTSHLLSMTPKPVKTLMKDDLRELQGASTRAAAEPAITVFAE